MKNNTKQKIKDFCYVTDFVANGSFSSLRENVAYLNSPNYAILVRLTDFTKKWKKDFVYVSKSSYDFLRKSSLNPGDLIMSNVGEPGIVFLVPDLQKPMTLGPNSILIRPKENFSSPKFLYHYFLTERGRNQINDISTGAAQKKFNKTSFREIEIPLPPIFEQHRIVTLIEKAFAAIEKAEVKTKENLQNAKELFESCLQGVFSNLYSDCDTKRLGDVCKTSSGGTPLKSHKEYYEGGHIPWLMSGEVSQGEIFNSKNYITEKGLKNSSAKLFPINTVLIAMYGATAGQVGILRIEASTNQAVCGILPNNLLTTEYLFYCFLYNKRKLISQAIGNAQPNISQEKIRNIEIPIISISKQNEVTNNLLALFNDTKKLERNFQEKLVDIEELKKSILKKAFAGDLTMSN